MSGSAIENEDLVRVEAFFDDHALRLERIPKAEARLGKVPDYRVFQREALVAYCEVKSPGQNTELEKALDAARPGKIVSRLKPDPMFNRLSGHVYKAAQQFDSVNSDRSVPNILIFVNHDPTSTPHDLVETLTGYFHATSGKRYPINLKVSEGRIKEAKRRIDLYIWHEIDGGDIQLFYSGVVSEHTDTLKAIFSSPQEAA